MTDLLRVDAVGGGVHGGHERMSVDDRGRTELVSAALLEPHDRAGRWIADVVDRALLDAALEDLPEAGPEADLPPGATALRFTLAEGRTVVLNADEQAAAPRWRPLVQWWRSTRAHVLDHPHTVVRLQAELADGTVRFTVTNPGTAALEITIDEGGFSIVTAQPDGSWSEAWRNDGDDRLGLITTTGSIVGGVLLPARLDAGATTRAAFAGRQPSAPGRAFFVRMRGSVFLSDGAEPEPFALAGDPA